MHRESDEDPVLCGVCGDPIEDGAEYVYDVEVDEAHAEHYDPDELA